VKESKTDDKNKPKTSGRPPKLKPWLGTVMLPPQASWGCTSSQKHIPGRPLQIQCWKEPQLTLYNLLHPDFLHEYFIAYFLPHSEHTQFSKAKNDFLESLYAHTIPSWRFY
jgi:hypothetical protein